VTCGLLFFVLLVSIGCHRLSTSRTTETDLNLTIGVPEGSVSGTELGAAEWAKMLTREGLTQVSADGRVTPRVAESWRWEKEGLRLRVFLRHNVKFHDGTQLTAPVLADVLKQTVADPANRGLYPSLEDVGDISAPREYELVIDCTSPCAFLPDDLAVPLEIHKDVATGPYRITRREKEGDVTLDKFDDYYLGRPSISRVVLRPFATLRTTWTSLLRGEVDMVTEIPPNSVEFIQNEQIRTIAFPHWYQFIVAFNSAGPPFRSAAVRRALNLAIDRDLLIKRTLKGYGTAATGPLWPKHWAYDGSVSGYRFDPVAAAALLDANGFPKGAAGRPGAYPGARLRFTCLIPADFSLLERIALEIQRQLYEVGVDMQFELVPATEFVKRIGQQKFEAVLVDMISGPTLSRPYIFWQSSKVHKGYNVFGYDNPDAEQLFQTLRTSMSEAAIRSATRRLERVMLDDPPALFLAWNERARVIRRQFNIYQEPGRDPISSLWRWSGNGDQRTASAQ
jgi:peptide/nickel transport system substrate-binding protein